MKVKSIFPIYIFVMFGLLALFMVSCDSDDDDDDFYSGDSGTVTPVSPGVGLLIVPGREAANITLGDTLNGVKAIYGEPPDLTVDLFTYLDLGLGGHLDDTGRVSQIHIFAPNKAQTLGGVGIGSHISDAKAIYGVAEDITASSTHYWKKGISFHHNSDDGIISDIFVFESIGAAPAAFDALLQRERVLEHKAVLERYYSTE